MITNRATVDQIRLAVLAGFFVALLATALGICLYAFLVGVASLAHARDGGQWSNQPPNVRQWFQSLMQPDNPAQSCCGEADSFEADLFEQSGDNYLAIVTDGRGMIANGTRIPVPNRKIKWDKGNPTGHGILFLSDVVSIDLRPSEETVYVMVSDGTGRILYCYVTPGGV